MYLKSIALFVAVYGRGALAALDASCQEADSGASTCPACTPLNTEYQPDGVGELYYSNCCTESETSSANPPVTTTKKYCYTYVLVGWPNNQYSGQKPSTCGTGNTAWSLEGQCTTVSANSNSNTYYTALTALSPNGCPGEYDSSFDYELGDTVSDDNGVVYTCSGSAQYCNLYGPDLKGNGLNYWKPTASCEGTATPTDAPNWSAANMQDEGCPEEYDSSADYGPGDKISVERDDGISILYQCKPFPKSQWCNDETYSPLNTQKLCNGETCWSEAWNRIGACSGTYTPTSTPTFDPANIEGCPEEYDDSADYEEGDKVSVTPAGEDYGKIYQCKSWPHSGHCGQEAYSPANTESLCNDKPCWTDAWTYLGGCYGTIAPTSTPTFDPADIEGCPEEYEAGTDYEEGDKVSVTPAGEDYGKIYKCKGWPHSGHCGQEAYSPANTESLCGDKPCWTDAWTYIGGCYGTIAPTSTPTFDPADVGGCPEEFEVGTDYEEGDTMSITPAGEDYGKIYKCKGWPHTDYCSQEAYSPLNTEKQCGGKACWTEAWTYEGGCYGTIAPTQSPEFPAAKIWELTGCPDEYVPNYAYSPGDYVSVPKNEDNTAGVVWQCKDAMSAPWCEQEGYAPGTAHGGEAWEKVGYCDGTIAPTAAPTPLYDNQDLDKHACQFKYKLPTGENGEYVIVQAESWVKGGTTIPTVSGGTPLDLYKAGNLVRYGNDARKCNGHPYTGYCEQYSPFTTDEANYNPTLSKEGWKDATCENVESPVDDETILDFDSFQNSKAVFASNGNLLAIDPSMIDPKFSYQCIYNDINNKDYGSGATNPEDYFKPSPPVKACRQCPAKKGFGCPIGGDFECHPDQCNYCRSGTTTQIVDRESQCVCDNGATDPWDDAGSHCQKCASGKRYLGPVVNADGDGKCVEECPSSHPYYTTYTDTAIPAKQFKLCCAESGCSTKAAGCYDGGDGACGEVTWPQ